MTPLSHVLLFLVSFTVIYLGIRSVYDLLDEEERPTHAFRHAVVASVLVGLLGWLF